MLMTAARVKKIGTRGALTMKIAAIATLMSMMYLRKGNILLPIHVSKYLYPYSPSARLHISASKDRMERRVQKT